MPLAQGPRDRAGYRDPPRSRLGRWEHGGKSEWAAGARPVAGGPSVHQPPTSYLPLRAAPWAEQAPGCPLRSAGAGSCHSSLAVGAASQVLLWVLSPRLSPVPRPACICRTPASPDTGAGSRRARGGREGLRPRRRAWRGPHFPGARAAARAPLRPGRRPRPQHPVPPAHHLCLPACGVEPHPVRPPAPKESREGSFHPVPRRSASSSSLRRFCNLSRHEYLSCSLSHPRVLNCG